MEIRWKVTDPLGNEVFLGEENFCYHIVGQHDSKDADVRKSLEDRVKYSLENPRFIVKAPNFEGRRVYLDLVDIFNADSTSIRPIFIVVEANNEVVTWFAKRTVNVNIEEIGGVIYDKRIHHLQIQRKI